RAEVVADVEPPFLEQLRQERFVKDRSLHEPLQAGMVRKFRQVGLASVGQVVDDPHVMPVFQQPLGHPASDETGAAGEQDVHRSMFASLRESVMSGLWRRSRPVKFAIRHPGHQSSKKWVATMAFSGSRQGMPSRIGYASRLSLE